MKIRTTLRWLLPLLFTLAPVYSAAQISQDLTEVKIPCWNCGNPNTDHRRYRNVAVMACTYGEDSGQVDHACEGQLERNILFQRDAWVNVEVCSGIEEVAATFGCQRVSLRARYEPVVTVDLPFIEYEDGMLIGTVQDIVVHQTLPNGDVLQTAYLPDLEIIYTRPPFTQYPADHPYNDSNGGEPEDAPEPPGEGLGNDDDDTDPGDETDPGDGGDSSGGSPGGHGGGNCNGGNHNAGVP